MIVYQVCDADKQTIECLQPLLSFPPGARETMQVNSVVQWEDLES